MSIEDSISIVSYSDCNTFSTPTDSTCAREESLNKDVRLPGPILLPGLLYRFDKRLIDLVYSLLSYAPKQIIVLPQGKG